MHSEKSRLFTEIQSELVRAKEEAATAQTVVQKLKENISADDVHSQEVIVKLEVRLSEAKGSAQQRVTALNQAQVQYTEAQNKVQKIKDDIEAKRQEAEQKVQALEAQITNTRKGLDAAIKSLQAKLPELKETKEKKREELDKAQTNLDNQNTKVRELNEGVGEAIVEFGLEDEAVKSRIEEAKAEKSKLDIYKRTLNQTQVQYTEAQSKVQKIKDDIEAKRQEADQKVQTLEAQITNTRKGLDTARSEERRVGKECRSRWSPYH